MAYRSRPTNHRGPQPSYDEWRHVLEMARDSTWLIQWQRRNNFSDEQAADVLALSVAGFRKQRSGIHAVSRQTAKLALLSAIDVQRMLDIAQWAMSLAQEGINRR